jgi:tRNA(Ile)-lysidine synthase
VHPLAERVLHHIRREELLKPGDRVGVAVSGGIDSVALLRLLLELRGELGIVLSVVHFNHKLRGAESEADEEFVAHLARERDLQFISDSDDVAGHAEQEHVSLEAAARDLRYGFFRSLLESESQGLKTDISNHPSRGPEGSPFHKFDKVVTGHTLDDQAETVLMRIIRGAGLRGLGGIHPRFAVEDDGGEVYGEILRPLLTVRRRELQPYLADIGQTWREDSTNADESFTRNRVRKLLVPLLEKEFNPSVAESLAELAEIARGEEDYWENEVTGWMGTAVHWSEPEWAQNAPADSGLIQIALATTGPSGSDSLRSKIENAAWLVMDASVSRIWFLGESPAVQRRLIKAIGEVAGIPLEFKHIEETLRFAAEEGKSGKELSLPLGWKVIRHPEELLFVTPDLRGPAPAQDYDYPLPIPGETAVAEAGLAIEVQFIPAAQAEGYNPDRLLDADSLPGLLRVRNWRAGDRFWPAHSKSPKKIKELLQELHVEQPQRRSWPVVVGGDEVLWVRGFPVSAKYRAKPHAQAILVTEKPLAGNS